LRAAQTLAQKAHQEYYSELSVTNMIYMKISMRNGFDSCRDTKQKHHISKTASANLNADSVMWLHHISKSDKG